jgi:hypothetical protein
MVRPKSVLSGIDLSEHAETAYELSDVTSGGIFR